MFCIFGSIDPEFPDFYWFSPMAMHVGGIMCEKPDSTKFFTPTARSALLSRLDLTSVISMGQTNLNWMRAAAAEIKSRITRYVSTVCDVHVTLAFLVIRLKWGILVFGQYN